LVEQAITLAVNLSGQFTAAPSFSAGALAVGFAVAVGLGFGIAALHPYNLHVAS